MKELLRTNDPVLLSWAESLLADVRIQAFVLDFHTSILEGSLGVLPRRLMVAGDEHAQARRVLRAADSSVPLSEAP